MLGRARAGCPCSSRVMRLFGIISRVIVNWAIICMSSTVVIPVLGSLRLGDG